MTEQIKTYERIIIRGNKKKKKQKLTVFSESITAFCAAKELS